MPTSSCPGDACGARRSGASGFTLLELLVVLAVIAIVAGIALPTLSQRAGAAAVRAAADTIANALRESRGLAIHGNAPVLFTLDVAGRRWAIEGGRSGRLSEDIGLALETDRRLLQSAEVGAIRFFSDGSASGGRIALQDGRARMTVAVDWLTGAVVARDD